MSTPSCFCANGILGCDDRNVTTFCDCALGQAKAELSELRDWVFAAELPTTQPKFLAAKYLIAERNRCRMALECALDYAKHMAPEDLTLIRAAYERAPIETK